MPILDQGHANNDQMDSGNGYQPTGPHGKGGHARPPVRYDAIPSTPSSSGTPTNRETKSSAISSPFSQESQRKIGNAIAMAAHAIGEGARALSEGTSYEPKPQILHWAGSNPGALQIGGCLAQMEEGKHQRTAKVKQAQMCFDCLPPWRRLLLLLLFNVH